MSAAPIPMIWDGEAFFPHRRFRRECDARFVVGETYRLETIEERSAKSHAHYFASLNECWQNLPDDLAEEYPSPEALRKKALIRTGYADERSIVCGSKAEALRVAAFIRPMDEHAIVLVSGAVVKHFTAQSQSMRAMGKQAFQASKDAVLAFAAGLIGVTPQAARRNAMETA